MLVVLVMVITALIGTVYMILPAAVILLPWAASCGLPPRAFRFVADNVRRWWLTLAAALIECVGGVHIVVTGNVSNVMQAADACSIIICNHHCRLDWMFLWCLVARLGRLRALNIALKSSLKKAPFFGWACQAFHFIFLHRNDRDGDLARIHDTLRHCLDVNAAPPLVLVFPEGTDLSRPNVAAGQKFAASKGLAQYTHVLHPRIAGFAAAVRALDSDLDAIYDVTISYTNHPKVASSDDPRPTEKTALALGMWPREVHFHIERIPASTLLSRGDDEEALGEWLRVRWAAKEARLAAQSAEAPRVSESGVPSVDYTLALVGWATCGAIAVWCLSRAWLMWVATLGGCAAWVGVTKRFDGMGELERRLFASLRKSGAAKSR